MKRTLIVAVMSAFAVALIANHDLPVGRSLDAAEAANAWGRGYLCHNGDPFCTVTLICANNEYPECELNIEQDEWPGTFFECLYWPFNNNECELDNYGPCLQAFQCRWSDLGEFCEYDVFDLGFVDASSYGVCLLVDAPDEIAVP